jgi:hypothetical protein
MLKLNLSFSFPIIFRNNFSIKTIPNIFIDPGSISDPRNITIIPSLIAPNAPDVIFHASLPWEIHQAFIRFYYLNLYYQVSQEKLMFLRENINFDSVFFDYCQFVSFFNNLSSWHFFHSTCVQLSPDAKYKIWIRGLNQNLVFALEYSIHIFVRRRIAKLNFSLEGDAKKELSPLYTQFLHKCK